MNDNESQEKLLKDLDDTTKLATSECDKAIEQWTAYRNKKKPNGVAWHIANLYIEVITRAKLDLIGIAVNNDMNQKLFKVLRERFGVVFGLLSEIANELENKASLQQAITVAQQQVSETMGELARRFAEKTKSEEEKTAEIQEKLAKLPRPDQRQFA
jgi:hypothetical protein